MNAIDLIDSFTEFKELKNIDRVTMMRIVEDVFRTTLKRKYGSDDNVVLPELSINMVKAIIKYGGSPKFTLYENVNHESWFNVFNDPNYLKWMFSFTKN